MANSQFRHYTNFDVGAPALNGITGSLAAVLDFCLVSGSGWLKTLNSASSVDGTNVYVGYRQPSGSGMYIFVNDNGPGVTSVAGKEAWASGWENLTNITGSLIGSSNASNPNMTASVGGGWGQFPLRYQAIQGITKAEAGLPIRKSVAATTTARNYQIFADDYTFYMFADTEGNSTWWGWWFGDIYSYAGSGDNYRCMIRANSLTNQAGASTRCTSDAIHTSLMDVGNSDGMYMVRSASGKGFSVLVCKSSPYICTGTGTNAENMVGQIPYPNPVDNAFVIAPITVMEFNWPQPSTAVKPFRGRMRGFWHLCHPVTSVTNGMFINGSGEYAGKRFQIIKPGVGNAGGGIFLIERSATVETN
jgi:hypothetical protein